MPWYKILDKYYWLETDATWFSLSASVRKGNSVPLLEKGQLYSGAKLCSFSKEYVEFIRGQIATQLKFGILCQCPYCGGLGVNK
jgi:hypothetical protein